MPPGASLRILILFTSKQPSDLCCCLSRLNRHDEWGAPVEAVIAAAVQQLQLGDDTLPVVELISQHLMDQQTQSLQRAFPPSWLHAYGKILL
jgi:hypothetical protein